MKTYKLLKFSVVLIAVLLVGMAAGCAFGGVRYDPSIDPVEPHQTPQEGPTLKDYLKRDLSIKNYLRLYPDEFREAQAAYEAASDRWWKAFPFIGAFPQPDGSSAVSLEIDGQTYRFQDEIYEVVPEMQPGGGWRIDVSQCGFVGPTANGAHHVYAYPASGKPLFLLLVSTQDPAEVLWLCRSGAFDFDAASHSLQEFQQLTADPYARLLWELHTSPDGEIDAQDADDISTAAYTVEFRHSKYPALHYCINYTFRENDREISVFNESLNDYTVHHLGD